jgi:hypothetical protein
MRRVGAPVPPPSAKGALVSRWKHLGLLLGAVLAAACTEPQVEIDVSPKQLDNPGLVEVSWKTQDLETTIISSNPSLSGLPKTVTGDASDSDSFQVSATTTFEIKGQTAQLVKTASKTVTVGPAGPIP